MEVKRLSDQWAQEEFILSDKLFLEAPEGSMAPFVIYLSLFPPSESGISQGRERGLGKFHLFKVGPIITGGVVVVSGRLIAFLSPPIPAPRACAAGETPSSFPIGHQ